MPTMHSPNVMFFIMSAVGLTLKVACLHFLLELRLPVESPKLAGPSLSTTPRLPSPRTNFENRRTSHVTTRRSPRRLAGRHEVVPIQAAAGVRDIGHGARKPLRGSDPYGGISCRSAITPHTFA
jgi:hypothetical protein